MPAKTNKNLYYLLSFIEGSCVMATELFGAKMLAPFFGSSLYVWATVLAMTLGGLALGYFFGGMVSYKYKKPSTLFYVMLLAAVFNVLMPFTSKAVLAMLVQYSLLPSIIISCLLFLLPPVFMMGMVSPLIISKITEKAEESGRVAGSVYAISTAGGIIATFLTGFYIIPTFGLTTPAVLNGLALGAIPLFMLIKQNKRWLLFAIVSSAFIYRGIYKKLPYSDIKVVYESDGLLGQILVADHPNYGDKKDWTVSSYTRILYFNRIGQSMLNLKTGEVFKYVEKFRDIIGKLPHKKDVLLLGLGGGTLANMLVNSGYHVDACELDKRVLEVSKKYFFLDNRVHTTIDDARHFIKKSPKKYDLIVFDVFKGEENPNHVFTVESLEETKKILNPGGVVMVNTNGFFSSSAGIGTRSIYKTLAHAGFYTNILPTTNDSNEDNRNLLFVASLDKKSIPENNYLVIKTADTAAAVVLQDNYPLLDLLNMEANKKWREGYIAYSIAVFNKRNVPLFK